MPSMAYSILGKKLLGIEGVPVKEQQRMVNRAISAARDFYDKEVFHLREALEFYADPKRYNDVGLKIDWGNGHYHVKSSIEVDEGNIARIALKENK